MKLLKFAGLLGLGVALFAGAAGATPTTNIWNPNTDIQAKGVLHVGIDNYFSVSGNATRAYAFPTDLGLTYGLGSGFEVGVDAFEPSANPLVLNAKWGLAEKASMPAFAVGIQGFGTARATQSNIGYGLLAKTIPGFGRLTAGGYTGRKSFLGTDNSGVIAAWDRSFGEKWWASVDYASGNNPYGALAVGGSYKLAPNVGLLVGYVMFNKSAFNPNDTVTTQLDIDF